MPLFIQRLGQSERLPWVIMGIGALLRLQHLLSNRSLWLDEAVLAVSINSRPLGDILKNIEIFPEFSKPPLLFAIIEKIITLCLGPSEMALRLFPFICAIAALPLFYKLVKKHFNPLTTLIALSAFAISDPLIYYAAEVKPYSTELLVALVFFWIFEKSRSAEFSNKTLILLGLLPAIGLWISNSLIFLMTTAALAITYEQLIKKNKEALLKTAGIFFLWGMSFLLLYKTSLNAMVSNQSLLRTFPGYILDKPLLSPEALQWVGAMITGFLNESGGLPNWSLLFLIIGSVAIIKKDLPRGLLIIAPVLLTLLAAALEKYPFRGRLLLFLVPGVIIGIAEGIRILSEKTRNKRYLTFGLLWILLLLPMTIPVIQHIYQTRAQTENREVLKRFKELFQEGDTVLLNTAAQPPFWYYASILGYGEYFQNFLGTYQGREQRGMRIAKFALDTIRSNGHECVPFRYEYHIFDPKGNLQRVLSASAEPSFFVCNNARFPLSQQPKRILFFHSTHDPNEKKIADIVLRSLRASATETFSAEAKNTGLYVLEFQK